MCLQPPPSRSGGSVQILVVEVYSLKLFLLILLPDVPKMTSACGICCQHIWLRDYSYAWFFLMFQRWHLLVAYAGSISDWGIVLMLGSSWCSKDDIFSWRMLAAYLTEGLFSCLVLPDVPKMTSAGSISVAYAASISDWGIDWGIVLMLGSSWCSKDDICSWHMLAAYLTEGLFSCLVLPDVPKMTSARGICWQHIWLRDCSHAWFFLMFQRWHLLVAYAGSISDWGIVLMLASSWCSKDDICLWHMLAAYLTEGLFSCLVLPDVPKMTSARGICWQHIWLRDCSHAWFFLMFQRWHLLVAYAGSISDWGIVLMLGSSWCSKDDICSWHMLPAYLTEGLFSCLVLPDVPKMTSARGICWQHIWLRDCSHAWFFLMFQRWHLIVAYAASISDWGIVLMLGSSWCSKDDICSWHMLAAYLTEGLFSCLVLPDVPKMTSDRGICWQHIWLRDCSHAWFFLMFQRWHLLVAYAGSISDWGIVLMLASSWCSKDDICSWHMLAAYLTEGLFSCLLLPDVPKMTSARGICWQHIWLRDCSHAWLKWRLSLWCVSNSFVVANISSWCSKDDICSWHMLPAYLTEGLFSCLMANFLMFQRWHLLVTYAGSISDWGIVLMLASSWCSKVWHLWSWHMLPAYLTEGLFSCLVKMAPFFVMCVK